MAVADHGRRPIRAARSAAPRRLAALVLAAGASSRMGRLKPLLPLAGSTVLERAVRTFLDAGVRDVTVVTGAQEDRLRPLLDGLGVRCVVNPDPDSGMYSSVVVGVSSLAPAVEGVFVLPVDMPAVRSRTVERLAAAFRATRADVVHPSYRGRRGHPPLVARRLFTSIVEASAEGGLRQVLHRFDERARAVPVQDPGVLLDLDTWDDYRALRAALGKVPRPPGPRNRGPRHRLLATAREDPQGTCKGPSRFGTAKLFPDRARPL